MVKKPRKKSQINPYKVYKLSDDGIRKEVKEITKEMIKSNKRLIKRLGKL